MELSLANSQWGRVMLQRCLKCENSTDVINVNAAKMKILENDIPKTKAWEKLLSKPYASILKV